jgi:hypothetical protein
MTSKYAQKLNNKLEFCFSIAGESKSQRCMADRFHIFANSELLGILQNTKVAKVLAVCNRALDSSLYSLVFLLTF